MFPRALDCCGQLPADSPSRSKFIADTSAIPVWQFIAWIPQLLAVLPLEYAKLSFPIVQRLAKEYPQAVIHPFTLANELWEQTPSTASSSSAHANPRMSAMLHELRSLVKNDLLTNFVDHLSQLNLPEMELKDMLEELRGYVKSGAAKAAQKCYQRFRSKNFSSASAFAKFRGAVWTTFIESFKDRCDGVFGVDGSKLLQPAYAEKFDGDFRELVKFDGIAEEAQKKKRTADDQQRRKAVFHHKFSGKCSLETYSLWFGQYEKVASSLRGSLEIPGQYTGEQCPQPELHVRIVNFDASLLIMGSIRKPKRLTINGSDERSYRFLVKSGEDLRMDQRIEQLFRTMNTAYASDAAAARRRMKLRTYEVIPLTRKSGLIEWVDNTEPLKAVILSTLPAATVIRGQAPDPGAVEMAKAQTAYNNNLTTFLKEYRKDAKQPMNITEAYNNIIKNGQKKRVVEEFRAVEQIFPSDLIGRALAKRCSTPEAFLVFRQTFARSFCTLSMSAYLLSLGDRHLENFLLDTSNAELVSIDFGAAFGQGALLGVPELMPIRYTRQFQHILDPLNTDAILRQDMTTAMSALRANKRRLLTIMDVFIREPQMEWIAQAKRAKASAEEMKQTNWYPRRKVQRVHMKLEGVNPAKVLVDEVSDSSVPDREVIKRAINLIRGDLNTPRHNLDTVCNSQQQVDLILDIAKDPNILGRTWAGWGPFV